MPDPAPLQYGQTYHIYSRGNNRQAIFVEERNYRHFLRLYARHVQPMADTYAYCLLPNHFHALLQIRDVDEGLRPNRNQPSQCISNLLNAYARGFNRTYHRTGSLFQRPFGRSLVDSDAYLTWLIAYIHQNPQKHGIADDYRTWDYSSYNALRSDRPTRLRREEVLAWFDGPCGFVTFHEHQVPFSRIAPLLPDDFD
jgi:REP element-mobilizing transposase RayT